MAGDAAAVSDAFALLHAGRFQDAGAAPRAAGVPWAQFDLGPLRSALEKAAHAAVSGSLEGLAAGILGLRLADATAPESWPKAIPDTEQACLETCDARARHLGGTHPGSCWSGGWRVPGRGPRRSRT